MLHPNKKYYTQTADQEDLISIGTIGLIKGISTFDASKGARLATYAARCVENEILMYFRSQKKTASDVSLSECIETGKDGTSLSLMDVIDSEEDLFEDLSAREMHGKLREIMQQVLTPREREILTLRYGLSNQPPQTQRELAARCGISRSYVSRIEKKALKKLVSQDTKDEKAAAKVIAKIEKLPAAEDVIVKNKSAISAARKAYDKLNENAKKYADDSAEVIAKLAACEKALTGNRRRGCSRGGRKAHQEASDGQAREGRPSREGAGGSRCIQYADRRPEEAGHRKEPAEAL